MALDMKIKGLLLETLEGLGQDDFKKFKFYTNLPERLKEENADRTDIAAQLMNRHGKNVGEKTIEILEKINNYNLAQKLRNDLPQITGSIFSVDNEQIVKFKRELQENLRKIYLNVPEGNTEEPLENVYTELNITRGVAGLPDKQHEVLQMEMCGVAEKESIQPCDIFESQKPLRTMLTVGFAGIGKTFLVRKFVLDWASGETNTDVDFIFPMAFRELNLEEGKRFSLAELIRLFVWESEGNLDYFIRFLLGLSLQCNQDFLGELLKVPKNYRHSKAETVRLIKRRIERNSPEENINLFYCLKELKDESLLEQIQQYLKGGGLSTEDLPPAMWSALVFFLRASDKAMSCFDLRKYAPSEKGLLMLLPVVKASQKSVLQWCKLTKKSCEALASVLSSSRTLSHLDLSSNDLCDDGLEALAAGLANPECTLQVLRLRECQLSKKSCEALASVLSSSRTLRELDLSKNDLCDDGLEALAAGLAKPQGTLQVLGLMKCNIGTRGCASLAKALRSNPSHLQQLHLRGNDIGEEGKRALEEVQMDSRCSLKIEWMPLTPALDPWGEF